MLACLSSGWNCFDFFVVCSSLLLLLFPDTPGISHLRTVRVLRVLRLFARVRSLRLIIIALGSILPQLKISEDFLDVLLEDIGKGADAGAAGAPVMSEERGLGRQSSRSPCQ